MLSEAVGARPSLGESERGGRIDVFWVLEYMNIITQAEGGVPNIWESKRKKRIWDPLLEKGACVRIS